MWRLTIPITGRYSGVKSFAFCRQFRHGVALPRVPLDIALRPQGCDISGNDDGTYERVTTDGGVRLKWTSVVNGKDF